MENDITEDGGLCENDIICPQFIILLSGSSMVDPTTESEENYTGEDDNYIGEVSKPTIDCDCR